MSQPVLLKVYAHITPTSDAMVADLEEAVRDAISAEEDAQVVFREGTLARVAFEGIYFPVDEVVEAFARHLTPEMAGKLDVLDLEAWRLTRYVFAAGKVDRRHNSLNGVLDYNGF